MKANTLIFLAAIAAAVYFLMQKGGIKSAAPTTNAAIPKTGNPVLIPTTTTNNYGLNDANAARLKALTTLAGSGTDLFKSIWGTPTVNNGPTDAEISDFVNLGIIS